MKDRILLVEDDSTLSMIVQRPYSVMALKF